MEPAPANTTFLIVMFETPFNTTTFVPFAILYPDPSINILSLKTVSDPLISPVSVYVTLSVVVTGAFAGEIDPSVFMVTSPLNACALATIHIDGRSAIHEPVPKTIRVRIRMDIQDLISLARDKTYIHPIMLKRKY